MTSPIAMSTAALMFIGIPIVGTLAYFTLRKPTDAEVRAVQAAAADRRR
jgi:hypothetical protein